MIAEPFPPHSAMCWKIMEGKIQTCLAIISMLLLKTLFWLRKTDCFPNSITYLEIVIFSALQKSSLLELWPLFSSYFQILLITGSCLYDSLVGCSITDLCMYSHNCAGADIYKCLFFGGKMHNESAFRKVFKKPDSPDSVIMTFLHSRFGIDNMDFIAGKIKKMKHRSQVSSKTLWTKNNFRL